MITDSFDSRTMFDMEVALERACLLLPTGSEKHKARRIIASKIIKSANRGDTTLSRLTEAGYAAAKPTRLLPDSFTTQSRRKWPPSDATITPWTGFPLMPRWPYRHGGNSRLPAESPEVVFDLVKLEQAGRWSATLDGRHGSTKPEDGARGG